MESTYSLYAVRVIRASIQILLFSNKHFAAKSNHVVVVVDTFALTDTENIKFGTKFTNKCRALCWVCIFAISKRGYHSHG